MRRNQSGNTPRSQSDKSNLTQSNTQNRAKSNNNNLDQYTAQIPMIFTELISERPDFSKTPFYDLVDKIVIKEITLDTLKNYLSNYTDLSISSISYSIAFGVFVNDNIYGVISYHFPRNRMPLGICGPNHTNQVTVISHFHISARMPVNTASYVIAQTIKIMNKISKKHRIFLAYLPARFSGKSFLSCGFTYTGITPLYIPFNSDERKAQYRVPGKYEQKKLFVRFTGNKATRSSLIRDYAKYNPKSV